MPSQSWSANSGPWIPNEGGRYCQVFLIPYQKIELWSAASPSDFLARLRRLTAGPSDEAPFQGVVGSDSFRLLPTIKGRNTYLPWLRGRVVASPTGTLITMRATLHPVAALFMTALVVGPQCVILRKEGQLNLGWLGATVLFHVVMCAVGFWPEVHRARERLWRLAREER